MRVAGVRVTGVSDVLEYDGCGLKGPFADMRERNGETAWG